MRPEEVTVTIMERNEEYFIGYIIAALIQYYPNILVFDHGSTDNTIDIIRGFPQVKLLERGNMDPAALGRERQIMTEMAETKWCLQIDGDEYYPPASLEALLKHEMPEGKKAGFVYMEDASWDGEDFRAFPPFNRLALFPRGTPWGGHYPFDVPAVFGLPELFHYFPGDVVAYHLHHLVRSSKDEEVYLRMRKRHQFCMQDHDLELGQVLNIEFEGNWPNPYLDYLRDKR